MSNRALIDKLVKSNERPLGNPADGARKIRDICKDKANASAQGRVYIEVVNRLYFEANHNSYAGFHEAVEHGVKMGWYERHRSGAHLIPVDDAAAITDPHAVP